MRKVQQKSASQIVSGIVIGVGLMVTLVTSAHARPTCPKDPCPAEYIQSNQCANDQRAGDPAGSYRKTQDGTKQNEDSCLDCAGSCTHYDVTYEVQYYTCQCYDGNTGQYLGSTYDYTLYDKTKKGTGAECDPNNPNPLAPMPVQPPGDGGGGNGGGGGGGGFITAGAS